MGFAKSSEGFPDCRIFMDRASAAERGTRAKFATEKLAQSFRLRLYAARGRDRKRNRGIYDQDHSMYDRSVWDNLVFLIEELRYDSGTKYAVAALHDGDKALEILKAEIEDI